LSDPLYLSLWFADFSGPEMLPHAFAVLQQFPFSAQRPGINYFSRCILFLERSHRVGTPISCRH